jgi:hypothetical protein
MVLHDFLSATCTPVLSIGPTRKLGRFWQNWPISGNNAQNNLSQKRFHDLTLFLGAAPDGAKLHTITPRVKAPWSHDAAPNGVMRARRRGWWRYAPRLKTTRPAPLVPLRPSFQRQRRGLKHGAAAPASLPITQIPTLKPPILLSLWWIYFPSEIWRYSPSIFLRIFGLRQGLAGFG